LEAAVQAADAVVQGDDGDCFQVYGRLMARPNRISIDAEATLFGPFILVASLLTYFAAFWTVLATFPLSLVLQFVDGV
jgi:hypothetical protein